MDPSAPVGSNAYNGWVVRVQRGRRYFDPTINDFREAKYFNPNGPDYDEVIINDTHMNALCYPNGNIYITSELYKRLTDDEMLTFVIAHEMAHYKNKDHLMNLRKGISNASIIIFMSIVSPNNQEASKIIEGTLSLSDLKYSRSVEAKADLYAAKILNELYGRTTGGVQVLKILSGQDTGAPEVLSDHPDIQKRIEKLQN